MKPISVRVFDSRPSVWTHISINISPKVWSFIYRETQNKMIEQDEGELLALEFQKKLVLKPTPPPFQHFSIQDINLRLSQLCAKDHPTIQKGLIALLYLSSRHNLQAYFKGQPLSKLIDLKNTPSAQKLQYLAINILSNILFHSDIVLNQYAAEEFIQSLNTRNDTIFRVVSQRLNDFLQSKPALDLIINLKVVSNLSVGICRISNDELINQGCILLSKILELAPQIIPIEQISLSFQFLLQMTSNIQSLNWTNVRTYSFAIFKYIFSRNMHCILLKKGVFRRFLRLFEHYPKIIQNVFCQLSKNGENLSNLLENEEEEVFRFITMVLPTTNLKMVSTIFGMVETILSTQQILYHLKVWQSEPIMNCLEESLKYDEYFALKAFSMYRSLLINNLQQSEIYYFKANRNIGKVVLLALSQRYFCGRNLNVIEEGLRLIYQVVNFEKKQMKLSKIMFACFTENLKESGLGLFLEDIYEEFDGKIKLLAFSILSQCFAKIEGQVESINLISRRKTKKHKSQPQ